jgi:hypothetical protein
MKLGKSKWLLSLSLAGGLLCSSYNLSYGDDTDKLINTEKSEGPDILCRKANFFSKTFSLRSGGGILCTQKYIAAYAVMLCRNKGDFNGSSCDQNAKKILGDEQYANPQAVLTEGIKSGGNKIRTLVCSQKGRLPANLQAIAAQNCP